MNRWLAAGLLAVPLSALADEAAIRRVIESKLGDAKIESIRKTPYAGLYEVAIRGPEGPAVYYVDETASVIVVGSVIDAKTGRNLTEERVRKLSAIRWDSLPFEWAVTTTRGNARRRIAIFSDPNCPYCRRFERDLAKLDDIAIHIFLYPVIRPESLRQTKSVWCSKDRAKAWNDLMLRDIQPTASPDCATPIDRIVELGRRLGADSTPTWFLPNGERFKGAMPLERVEPMLDAAALGR
jgi:thiol:disulfide interchange protein DsbC